MGEEDDVNLSKFKLIIFDMDGTLRRCTIEGQPCPNGPDEWELMPNVKERLAEIDWSEIRIGVASNQAGVAFGYISYLLARRLLMDSMGAALGWTPPKEVVRLCPHTPGFGCRCRKPQPGMLLDIMRFWGVGPDETLFVGDMESDRQTAENAGIAFEEARVFFS